MPTAKGFTGLRQDAVSGLDESIARYYDLLLGQFGGADSKVDGLNRSGSVCGNPKMHHESSYLTGEHWASQSRTQTRGV